MTDQQLPNSSQSPTPAEPGRRRSWSRAAAVTVAAVLLIGAGGGVGMAFADAGGSSSTTTPAPTAAVARHSGKLTRGRPGAGQHRVDPARQAWAEKYGLDRSTMPTMPDVTSASPQQQAAAKDLLLATEAATARYSDLTVAKAAGFDLYASLAKKEAEKPKLAGAMQPMDSAQTKPGARMPMLHVGNDANRADGKVLDPNAPETLMYSYQGQGKWMLVGVMYTANESYPQAPPDPGGPITRWHYHTKSGGQRLMMHVFFVPGNDLAHAYATEMTA